MALSSVADVAAKTSRTLASTSRLSMPDVTFVYPGADPAFPLLSTSSNDATAFVGHATNAVCAHLLASLPLLSGRPAVLHLASKPNADLTDTFLIRSGAPVFLLSSTAQQAYDHALIAIRIAKSNKTAVVHAFYDVDGKVKTISDEDVEAFVADRTGADNLYGAYESARKALQHLTHRAIYPISGLYKGAEIVLVTLGDTKLPELPSSIAVASVSLLSPSPTQLFSNLVSEITKRIVVCEPVHRWPLRWTPIYLDVLSALQHAKIPVQSAALGDTTGLSSSQLTSLLSEIPPPGKRILIGTPPNELQDEELKQSKMEEAYTKMLRHLFGDALEIVNDPSTSSSHGQLATTPEFALGRARGQIEARASLVFAVHELLQSAVLPKTHHAVLSAWVLAKDDASRSRIIGEQVIVLFKTQPVDHPAASRLLLLRSSLPARVRWIIGSDSWAYDLGASGLHHLIASSLDVSILIIDNTPYPPPANAPRKQDAGLYALNRGDVYVASVAAYSSHSQALQGFLGAARHRGPSVVLGYLPEAKGKALEILKQTKRAVDSGSWPLYRWDPSLEEPFMLDSDSIKRDLQTFLDRQNHLSQLSLAEPKMAAEIVGSLGETLKAARRARAKEAYAQLVSAIDAPPLRVLCASDGGNAEKIAKRLVGRATARGLEASLGTLDSSSLDELSNLQAQVVFITSTAGQGEPPQNGRTLFKALNRADASDAPLKDLKYSVFGIGDSHYWPRPEDKHYYNKPGKDLHARLAALGATELVPLGLGDDQDPDGPQTGYKAWEPLIWKAFGVDNVIVTEAEPEPITNEHIKAASRHLRGTIVEGLKDTSTGALAPSDGQLTKFHGIYQQDDRDIRDERQAAGVEPAYSFMIRVRMPGGVCTPDQWLAMDQIADEHGNGTFKITTRQTFQFHGVIKRHLKPSIQAINKSLLDTLAACGDVNRNVICSAIPSKSKLHARVYEFCKRVSERLLPRTAAYHEIWLDKHMVAGEAIKDVEPLYGEFYLPRKFKIAVAVPPTNDVDIFANDLGYIAIVGKDGELAGFNVTIGGGMGVTHANKKTYPRTADVIGFCTVEQGPEVAEKVMLVQRDHGNRADRKNARLKYTIDRMGLDVFKAEVETLLGYALPPARAYAFDRNIDDFGWSQGEDARHHFTMFVENGRVQDEPGKDFKTGLREIAKVHKGTFRCTANQHIVLSDIPSEEVGLMKSLLSKYGLDNLNFSGLRLSSSACVAFPTCGLAMAESERYLPILIDKVEKICEENGLRNDSIVMRMTGCPNGCARPYVAEVAFVGKAPGSYMMLLGGGYYGQRLNKIYRETVSEPEILAILAPMIKRYALERLEGEKFGDFVIRSGYIAPTTSGKEWYDGMGGSGEWREVVA